MLKSLLIFLGAGLGGVLRFWIGGLVQSAAGKGFPFGTMAVNVSGCLVIGFLVHYWGAAGHVAGESPRFGPGEGVRDLVLIGVLGGYTTFSTFGRETVELASAGHTGRAAAYALGSLALGLIAVWVGARIGALLHPGAAG